MRLRGLPGWAGQSLKQGGRVVSDHTEAFVAFDTSKLRNAVAIAEAGRSGEVRFLGEIDNTGAATSKLVRKLAAKYGRLTFCYEAGPTGYGLYRQIVSLGHECLVVAPSLVPKKPGDRVKTNRRDATSLAKLSRAGELTAVWVPDERHEAMRDLSRARGAAKKDLQGKRQQISSLMLRLGRIYPGKKTWGPAHMNWLMAQKLEHREQRIAFEELVPKKPGERVKTNQRDAVSLAKLSRAGELTAVWVPDERHEAMRDLSRARQAAKKDLQGKRQQISSLMLRLGRIYRGKTTWGPAHM